MARTLLVLAALVHYATPETLSPRYEYDSRTAADCIGWANIDDAAVDTCNATRTEYHIDPARFRAMIEGRAGVGGIYDGWRRMMATVRGRTFDPSHEGRAS